MTLPVGTISMSQVNVELGQSATQIISLNDANVRSLAEVPSGTISMSNLQGKSAVPAIGQPWKGGFYAGKMSLSQNQVPTHYLIVSPRSTEVSLAYGPLVDQFLNASSEIDGLANTNTLAAMGPQFAAATYCKSLTIGGFDDWYLPAIDEWVNMYWYLKPTTALNNAGSERTASTSAVPPQPFNTPNTPTAPAQTTAPLFQNLGAEYFGPPGYSYWTSTQVNSAGKWDNAWYMAPCSFTDGFSGSVASGYENYSLVVRAVRRVPI